MKKLLSMMLAVLMLLTASAAFAEEGGDVVTLDVFYASSRPMNEATELTHQYMIDNLGIDFNLIQGDGGNFTQQLSLYVSGGDMPDVVMCDYSVWRDYALDGAWADLSAYINEENCPDLMSYVGDNWSYLTMDDQILGVPSMLDVPSSHVTFIRQDWLDNLGLETPTTLDEFTEVMRAFTTQDPDGNGQSDTVGYTAEKPASGSTGFDWVFFAYGREYADYALDDSGNVIPWFEDDGFVPAMTYIKDLWDSGFVDKELMLNDSTKKEEKFYQGRVGFIPATLYRHVSRQENSLQELNPDATIVYDLPPAGEDGSFGLNKQGKSGMFTCITAACQNQAKAAEFINFMVSEEGNELLRLGLTAAAAAAAVWIGVVFLLPPLLPAGAELPLLPAFAELSRGAAQPQVSAPFYAPL